MDYVPKYKQPFTLEQAILLDVSIITEEIARLQNSLDHLKQTQETLFQEVTTLDTPDRDLYDAYRENETVIGSQEERIGMLKLALAHKGVILDEHNHLKPADGVSYQMPSEQVSNTAPSAEAHSADEGSEDGVHL